jgi:hypothetical protein
MARQLCLVQLGNVFLNSGFDTSLGQRRKLNRSDEGSHPLGWGERRTG